MSNPDRFFMEEKVRDIINNKIKKTNFLNMNNTQNREIFLFAVSLGIDTPKSLTGKKEGLFLAKDLDINTEALLYGIFLSELSDIGEIANKNRVFDHLQNCANFGFRVIEDTIDNSSIENIDKEMLLRLDDAFDKIVF